MSRSAHCCLTVFFIHFAVIFSFSSVCLFCFYLCCQIYLILFDLIDYRLRMQFFACVQGLYLFRFNIQSAADDYNQARHRYRRNRRDSLSQEKTCNCYMIAVTASVSRQADTREITFHAFIRHSSYSNYKQAIIFQLRDVLNELYTVCENKYINCMWQDICHCPLSVTRFKSFVAKYFPLPFCSTCKQTYMIRKFDICHTIIMWQKR